MGLKLYQNVYRIFFSSMKKETKTRVQEVPFRNRNVEESDIYVLEGVIVSDERRILLHYESLASVLEVWFKPVDSRKREIVQCDNYETIR